jgi:chemotaxis signal transduction protein
MTEHADLRESFLVCRVGERLVGVRLGAVERVERMVEIQRVPGSPAELLGALNYHGELVGVLDLRPLLGCRLREAHGSDQLVVLGQKGRVRLALFVNQSLGVFEIDRAMQKIEPLLGGALPGEARVEALAILGEEVVVLAEGEKLLSRDSEAALEAFGRRPPQPDQRES